MKRKKSGQQLLPATSSAEDLETVSRHKLSLQLTSFLFEIRPELQRDKGIDLIVELKQDNTYTNFRFAIQLKSTASAKTNSDHSVSHPVDVSNVNYLLNYGMPAYYILYDHAADIFYVEQAHYIFQALSKKYQSKKFPRQFTARFSKRLVPETIKEIYQATLENGLLLRQLNAHLGLASGAAKHPSGIVIDDENEVYSVEQNIEFINQYGLLLINRTEFKRITEIEQRTHPRTTASPMFNLVCGVAYFAQSNLFKAIEFLKAANNAAASFEPDIRSMLEYTYLNARHLLGIISEADFKKGIAELMKTENLGSFLELEKAYTTFIDGTGPQEIRIRTLQNKLSSLIANEPANANLRIRAYSIILSIEGKQLIHNLPLNFVLLCGRVPDLFETKTYKQWKQLDERHSGRLGSLLKYCLDMHDFLAAGNIAMDISEWTYQKCFIFYVLKNWDTKSSTVKGTLTTEELDSLTKEAIKIDNIIKGYEMLDHRENMVHALSFKYELLNFAGRTSDAEATASQIASLIESHEMNSLKPKFQSLLSGESRYKRFISFFTEYISNIYRVAKNSGLEGHFTRPVPAEYLKSVEFLEQEQKWMDGDFFELQYPSPSTQEEERF